MDRYPGCYVCGQPSVTHNPLRSCMGYKAYEHLKLDVAEYSSVAVKRKAAGDDEAGLDEVLDEEFSPEQRYLYLQSGQREALSAKLFQHRGCCNSDACRQFHLTCVHKNASTKSQQHFSRRKDGSMTLKHSVAQRLCVPCYVEVMGAEPHDMLEPELEHQATRREQKRVSAQRRQVVNAASKVQAGVVVTMHLAESGIVHSHVTHLPKLVAAGVSEHLTRCVREVTSAWQQGRSVAAALPHQPLASANESADAAPPETTTSVSAFHLDAGARFLTHDQLVRFRNAEGKLTLPSTHHKACLLATLQQTYGRPVLSMPRDKLVSVLETLVNERYMQDAAAAAAAATAAAAAATAIATTTTTSSAALPARRRHAGLDVVPELQEPAPPPRLPGAGNAPTIITANDCLEVMGRQVHDTPADGDCVVNASLASRAMADLRHCGPPTEAMTQAAKDEMPNCRTLIKGALLSKPYLKEALAVNLSGIVARLATSSGYEFNGVPTVKDLASAMGEPATKGGCWLGTEGLRACAVVLRRDILAIQPTGPPILYPKGLGSYKVKGARMPLATSGVCGIMCGGGKDAKVWFPALVFEPDVIVIVYNGVNHYNCTSFAVPPAGQEVDAWLLELKKAAAEKYVVAEVNMMG